MQPMQQKCQLTRFASVNFCVSADLAFTPGSNAGQRRPHVNNDMKCSILEEMKIYHNWCILGRTRNDHNTHLLAFVSSHIPHF